jgi:O-antigen ligase
LLTANKLDLRISEKVILFAIVTHLVGYQIFGLLGSVLPIPFITQLFRIVTIVALILAVCLSKIKLTYTRAHIFLFFCIIGYILRVLIYFANGFENDFFNFFYYFQNLFILLLIPILLISFDFNNSHLEYLKKVFFGYSFIFILLLLIFLPLSEPGRLGFERLNPISIALYLGAGLVVAANCKIKFSIKLFHILLSLYLMLLSGSRGPLLALLLCLFIFLLFKASTKVKVGLGGAFIAVAIVFMKFITDLMAIAPALARFNPTSDAGYMSVGIRFEQYMSAINIFTENIFFGGSLLEQAHNYYPHNLFLELAMSTGLVGIFIIVFLASLTVSKAWKLADNQKWIVYLTMYFIISMMFSASIATSYQLLILLLLVFRVQPHKLSSKNIIEKPK